MTVRVLAGFWGFDLESRELLLCPRSRLMFGLMQESRKRLAGFDWKPRIHPDDIPLIEGELETARRNNEVYAARFRTVHPDGRTCEILGVGRPTLKDPKRYVGLNFDLQDTAAIAERHSRTMEAAMNLAVSMIQLGTPANENDSRPWRAWSVTRAAHSRSERSDASSERRIFAQRAQAMFDRRQLRKAFLNPIMLGEPAFDLLLALYMPGPTAMMTVQALGERIDASLGVTVRWLKFLVNEGLALTVEDREADPAGTLTAALTDKARVALDEYFRRAGDFN
jgi:PAS domain-containing protein